jgi:hypothetical protein
MMDKKMDEKMKKKNLFKERRIRRFWIVSKAQGLVEFALILPVILLTLFVLVELARVLHAWMAIENGARAGVRYAVTAEYNPDYCPPSGCITEKDEKDARVASIHDAAWAGSSSIVRVGWDDAQPDEKSFFDVIVCNPENLLAPSSTFDTYSCDDGENPSDPGKQVVVVVEFNHPLIAPLLTSVWPQLRLDAKREAKVETYRVPQPVGTAPDYWSPTPKPTNTLQPTSTWTPGPPPPDLCKDRSEWRRSGGRTDYSTYMNFLIHESHGWDTGPLVHEAYITSVSFEQDTNSDVFRVNEFEFEHPGTSKVTINVGERDDYVEVSGLNIPLFYCYPDYCDNKYHAMYVEVEFNGIMDGEYELSTSVYFPEYDKTCYLGFTVDTEPPEPEPTDTPGPSPTDEPWEPEPTDTRRPTDTPEGPIDTPEPPPD